jgi:hypothetical protein
VSRGVPPREIAVTASIVWDKVPHTRPDFVPIVLAGIDVQDEVDDSLGVRNVYVGQKAAGSRARAADLAQRDGRCGSAGAGLPQATEGLRWSIALAELSLGHILAGVAVQVFRDGGA